MLPIHKKKREREREREREKRKQSCGETEGEVTGLRVQSGAVYHARDNAWIERERRLHGNPPLLSGFWEEEEEEEGGGAERNEKRERERERERDHQQQRSRRQPARRACHGGSVRDGLHGAQALPEGRRGQVSAAGLPLLPGVQRGPHPGRRQRPLQHHRAPQSEGLRAQPGPDPGRGRGGARPPALRDVLRRGAVRREDAGLGHGEGGQHRDAGAQRAVQGLRGHAHVPAQRGIRPIFHRVSRVLLKDQILTVPHQPVQHRLSLLVVWDATQRSGRPRGDPPLPLPRQRPPRLQERSFGQHRNLRLAQRVGRLSQPLRGCVPVQVHPRGGQPQRRHQLLVPGGHRIHRLDTGLQRSSAGPLSSGHLPLRHHLPGLPDEAEARAPGRGVRVRAPPPQHHLAQLQLHGSAAAVRVAAARHLLRRRGRRHRQPAAGAQDHHGGGVRGGHAHLAVHLQLPGVGGEPCVPSPQPPHHLPRLLMDGLCLEELRTNSVCQHASRAGRRGEATRCLI